MMIWPEIRSAYKTRTGKELAKQDLATFINFVIEYSVNQPDGSHHRREAFLKMVDDEPIEGEDGPMLTDQNLSDMDELTRMMENGVE